MKNFNDKKDASIFLDPLAPFSKKLEKSYGMGIAKLIQREWFGAAGARDEGCNFYHRSTWIRKKRLLARGEQNMKDLKGLIDPSINDDNGEKGSYANLDWRPINVVEKFCNIVSNGISDENYLMQVNAIDPLTAKLKKEKEDRYKMNMHSKKITEVIKNELDIDLEPMGFVPEDVEEMEIHMQMHERDSIEIGEEFIIDYVKKVNRWKMLERQKNRDLVHCGIASARVFADSRKGIQFEYVDPEFLIHSYQQDNDFKKAHYFGYVDTMTLGEINASGEFTEDQLREILTSSPLSADQTRGNVTSKSIDELLDEQIDVLHFTYKTMKTMVFKKETKGGSKIKVSAKSDDYNPPKRNDYKKISTTDDTWIEGVFIIGTNHVFKYKECEYLIRNEDEEVISPFVVITTDLYENRLHSFLNNIEPLSKQIQIQSLKIQHLVLKLRPDGVVLDIDALAELGDGDESDKVENWKEVLNLYNVEGIVFQKTSDDGEGGKTQRGVSSSASQQGAALIPLLNVWANYANQIREITGVNPFRDGTQSQDALVGVGQMALLASNTATKHIVEAAQDFHIAVCERISLHVTGIFKKEKLRKRYEDAVGVENVNAVELLKGRALRRFGFFVELKLTQQEALNFREDLNYALKEGHIDIADKMEAQAIADQRPKLARQFLIYRRNKNLKAKKEEQSENQALQAQANIETAQGVEQAKSQSYQNKVMIDIEKEKVLSQIRIAEEQAKAEIQAPIDGKKFQFELYKKKMETDMAYNLNKFKEDEKTSRQDRNNTDQSKMIAQRKKEGAEPIDFENRSFSDFV